MFGYIRPMQGELKVRELERFKACYCGLCHTLRRNYGLPARFILRYELVLLSMLFWEPDELPDIRRGRCIASPFRRRCYCMRTRALEICAGYTVILTYWKLRDSITDESFIKGIPYRLAALTLRRAYKKAAMDYPAFSSKMKEEMTNLAEYEHSSGHSLDQAADKFSKILEAAVPDGFPDSKRRPLLELLYHLGRWIYIIDACDDYSCDARAGLFNPIAGRFPPDADKIPASGAERLKITLTHSNNLLCSAFELLPENTWTEIVRNIIYLGMPYICEQVLKGDWPPKAKLKMKWT